MIRRSGKLHSSNTILQVFIELVLTFNNLGGLTQEKELDSLSYRKGLVIGIETIVEAFKTMYTDDT